CMFIMHGDYQVPMRVVGEERGAEQKLKSFLDLAKKDRIYAEFRSVDDLRTKVIQSLVALREALEKRAAPSLSTAQDSWQVKTGTARGMSASREPPVQVGGVNIGGTVSSIGADRGAYGFEQLLADLSPEQVIALLKARRSSGQSGGISVPGAIGSVGRDIVGN